MSMGIFSRKDTTQNTNSVQAQYAPSIMGENLNSFYNYVQPRLSRNAAMSVPSVARARNLIAGVISGLPLYLYR